MVRLARCLCGPRLRSSQTARSHRVADAARASSGRSGRADPTGTASIQRKWSRDLDQRWATISRLMADAVKVRLDPVAHIMHSAVTGQRDPVLAFQSWLDEAMRQVVLGINGAWLLPYVRQATDAGALHARTSTQSVVSDAFNPDQPRDDDGKWTTSGGSIVAYHGTTSDRVESIKKNGLKVSGVKRVYSKTSVLYEGRKKSVFVTSSFDEAESYAYNAKNVQGKPGTKSVVLTLKIPKSEWKNFKNDEKFEGSWGTAGAYSTKDIPPKWIKKVTVTDADDVVVYLVVVDHPTDVKDAVEPQDRTHTLQTLAITELQGIMEVTSQRAVRAFADGYLQKKSAPAIARDVRQVIDLVGQQRGRLLVSFMTVKSHAAATLDGFRARGIQRVGLVPELRPAAPPLIADAKRKKGMVSVLTAEDDRVCPVCEEIAADGPYYIDEAEALIPAHPRCRCAFAPADEDEAEEFFEDSATHVAAGVMITADNTGRTLFLRRSSSGDQGGTWAFPGGAVEPGETIEGAAARETREEIGYDPSADMERGHRGETNGVDFTTFIHSTEREFRPMLNHEHDAYKWVLVENAPEPLHPGVERTLDQMDAALRMRDEGTWDPDKHPRDKDGKFTFAGTQAAGAGDKITAPHEPENIKLVAKGLGIDVEYYPPAWGGNHHVFIVPVDKADKMKELISQYQHKTLPGNGVVLFKVPTEGTTLEKQHGTFEEHKAQAKAHAAASPKPVEPEVASPIETKVAPAPEHPAQKWFSSVKATGAERVAWKDELKKTLDPVKRKELQEKIVASFWKQHQQLTKSGSKPDKVKDIETKMVKYTKSYSMTNPLKSQPTATPAAKPATKYYDVSTPHGNFAQALENEKIPHQTGIFGPNSPHAGQQYVAFGSASDNQKALVAQIAKYHPQMEPIPESPTIYKPKSSTAAAVQQPATTPTKPFGKAAPLPAQPQSEIEFSSLKKVGEQMGSNTGGVYEDAHGQRYYVKTMDEAHAKNELLAAELYRLADAPTLNYVPIKPEGDKHFVATKLENLDKKNTKDFSAAEKEQAQENFGTHAWLANWDAAGTGGDNQGVKDGIVKTLDVGGALEYRAKGSPKGDAFGTAVNEINTLRDGPSADNNKLFGKMTVEQIKESVAKVAEVSDADIRKAVYAKLGQDKGEALANKLIARKNNLVASAEKLGVVAGKAPDLSGMDDEQQRLYWLDKSTQGKADYWSKGHAKEKKEFGLTDAEYGFIRAFTGPFSHVNEEMRNGAMNDHVFAFKHIMNDALDKMPKYDGDKVWRKIGLTPSQQAMYEPGKIVHWQAFSSTSKNSNTWSGNTHFTIHKPKSGVDVSSISSHPSEAEVIMPADTYYRVLSRKQSGGTTYIELEEVLPFGKAKKQKKAA